MRAVQHLAADEADGRRTPSSRGVAPRCSGCCTDDVDPGTEERLALQARVYADLLGACLDLAACKSWTVFGFSDRYAWDELGDASPLLFDEDYVAKPAYYAVQDRLR
jgi:GH35 family endo-1,4-beta-xylanase